MSTATAPNLWWNNLSRMHQILIVAITSILLYGNTLNHGYTIDDAIVITQNDFTKKGIKGLPELFKYDTFRGFFKVEGKDKLVSGGRYRPLSLAMFAIEYEIFGDNPFSGHLINILCFSLLCVLIFLFLERLFLKHGRKPGLLPLVITLLFAFHPIHTEVVANIKGRDEILSMLLGTWALYLLLSDNKTQSVVLSAAVMFLAMMAKEMAATFVPVAFLIFFVFGKQNFFNSVKSTWPLLVGMLPYLAIRFAILGTGEAVYGNMEMMNNPFVKFAGGKYVLMTPGERVASIIFCLGYYVKLLVIPHPLSHDYYPRAIGIPEMGSWEVLVSLLIYGGLIWAFFKWYRSRKVLSFGIAYFIVSLILISNILFPVGTHMGERFAFMGSLGFCIAVGRLIWKKDKKQPTRIAVLGVVLALFAMKTMSRNTVWVSDFSLFQTDVLTMTNSAKLNQAAGGSLIDKCILEGGENCDEANLRKGLKYVDKAIKIHPAYKTAYILQGNAHYILQEYPQAITSFLNYQRFSSTPEKVHSNLVKAYMAGAKTIGETGGDVNVAMDYLGKAEQIEPNNPELLRLMGVAYGVKEKYQRSIDYFLRLSEIAPNNPQVYENIARGYGNLRQPAQAQIYFQKAAEVRAQNKAKKEQQAE